MFLEHIPFLGKFYIFIFTIFCLYFFDISFQIYGNILLRRPFVQLKLFYKYQQRMSKVKTLTKKKQTKKELLSRVRKEGRYSSLMTITMWLLKDLSYEIYQNEKFFAELEGITTQKNYFFSVLRMSLAYDYLIDKKEYKAQQAAKYIFEYIQSRLSKVILDKYGKTNPKIYLQMVYEKNQHDLGILKNVFQSKLKDVQDVQKYLLGLYEQKSIKQHGAELSKLARIIVKYCVPSEKKEKESNNKEKNLVESTAEEQIPNIFESKIPEMKNKKKEQIGESIRLAKKSLPKREINNEEMRFISEDQQDYYEDEVWNSISDFFCF